MTKKTFWLTLLLLFIPKLLPAASPGESRGATQGSTDITIQSHRITQGLEWEGPVTTPRFYDMVAGKDTLVQAEVNSRNTVRGATCIMQRGTASRSYTGELRRTGDRLYVISCWIPGADLGDTGSRTFEIRVDTAARSYQLSLGIGRDFRGTADLRILVAPWIFPSGHPAFLPWNDSLALNVVESMMEMNRRFPMRTGVGNFSFAGRGSGNLRFHLALPASPCESSAGETIDQAQRNATPEIAPYRIFGFEFTTV